MQLSAARMGPVWLRERGRYTLAVMKSGFMAPWSHLTLRLGAAWQKRRSRMFPHSRNRNTWVGAALMSLLASTLTAQDKILVLGGEGRHCGEDPHCINRLHPAIPMAAQAKPGQTLLLKARNASDFDLDPATTYDDPRIEIEIPIVLRIDVELTGGLMNSSCPRHR